MTGPARLARTWSTPSTVLPAGSRIWRTRSGARSVRFSRRTAVVTAALGVAAVALGAIALSIGDYYIPLGDVMGTLLGDRDGLADSIVANWRLPRVLAAILFGGALGASGALFQSLAANPLASPDVVGFDRGAMTGALLVLLVFDGGPGMLTVGALTGGLGAALLVYLLAYRQGVQGFRLILVGISVSAVLMAIDEYLILRAIREHDLDLENVRSWTIGSLNGLGWNDLGPAGAVLAVLVPAALALGRPMRWIEMGDDAALALGVRINPVRLAAVVVGVGLTATVTAVCGPISFVALAAPQLAKRLAGAPGLSLGPTMLMGSVLLLASDVVAQHAFDRIELPAGAITVTLGGGYFVWLLAQERRRR